MAITRRDVVVSGGAAAAIGLANDSVFGADDPPPAPVAPNAGRTRLQQFQDLTPSFIGFGLGTLKDFAQAAYAQGSIELTQKLVAGDSSPKVMSDGTLPGGPPWPIVHGHLPNTGPNIPDKLSGICPYQLTLQFNGDALAKVELTLFLLNPRFVVAEQTFIPANVGADRQFTRLASRPVACGFFVISDPDATVADRFRRLTDGLPLSAMGPAPSGYVQFTEDTLVGRLDFKLAWELGTAAKYQQDVLGRVIGIPDATTPSGITVTSLALFSPALATGFNGLLWPWAHLGLQLSERSSVSGSGPQFILNPLKKPSSSSTNDEVQSWKSYRTAVSEFGLTTDFKGMLFEGVAVHWLNDNDVGHVIDLKLGMSAISFGKGTAVGREATWYTSFEAGITVPEESTYLSMLSELKLRAVVAENEPQTAILTGTFNELDYPFGWLSKRKARIAARKQIWKDASGDKQESMVFDLGIETQGEDVLARFSPEGDAQNAIAVALVLAPIVLAQGALDVHGKGVPPQPDSRAFFADIQPADSMAVLYSAALLGWFFKNSVKIRELRVVGVRLQSQPAVLNSPGATGNDTALLLDYETDFNVEVTDKIKSRRDISVRIDGTGFALTNGPRWVQVPSGVRELALADPGLWELGALGKVLKIAEVTVRRDPRRELILKLRLSGNLGLVTAGDFVFIIDLEDGTGLKLQAFPSAVSLEIPSTLKGTGILLIDKGGKDVAGSLDLAMLSTGLRIFGGARVSRPEDGAAVNATSFMATARVVFPTMIPIASTGLGIRGFDGLYAAHFERDEQPPGPAVPAALKWLKDVKGDVVQSITAFPKRWKVAYDHWSFGLGVVLGLVANPKLLNMNGMLVVELPGPRLIVFAKANLLKEPKENEQVQDELDSGVLGLLEFNVPRGEITFAALADLKFGEYVSFRGPLELFFSIRKLSSWHLYLGHFNNKISATLEIGGVAAAGVSAYFMAAGDLISKAPLPEGPKDLAGFALALGCEAYVKIGNDSLYVRVDFRNYLYVSLSDTLYASGGVLLSGEIRLFIISIGANGTFSFDFIKYKNGATSLHIHGSICGHAKLGFVEVSGCVTLTVGTDLTDATTFPSLITSVKLVAGTNVALHGQGVLGPIDGVLDVAAEIGSGVATPVNISLDAVIAIGMDASPRIPDSAHGFAAEVARPAPTDTAFRIGAREGYYELQSVRLWRMRQNGQREEIDYAASASTWWVNAQSPAGGQPIPRELALLTRNPLAANNAVISEEDLKAWVDAIVGGICELAVEPQACLYVWRSSDIGTTQNGTFVLPAMLCDSTVERKIGRTGAIAADFRLDRRAGFGSPTDPLAGLPAIIGRCIGVPDPETGNAVPMIAIDHRVVILPDGSSQVQKSTARLRSDILPRAPLDLLLAHRIGNQLGAVNVSILSRGGVSRVFTLANTAMVRLENLALSDVQARFHNNCVNWKSRVETIARTSTSPELAGAAWLRAQIDLSSFSDNDPPVEIVIAFNDGLEQKADATLFIAALKYIPFAELARFEADVRHRQGVINDLGRFLKSDPIPLLEPASQYQLEVVSLSVGDNTPAQTRTFAFETTSHPPVSARPYLLALFPESGARFHYLVDRPGFALASTDLLRMLEKFPEARIKVTITEDAGNPVLNADKTLKWHEGVVVDPRALHDPLHDPPKGFIRDSIASLPSALRQVIAEKVASGELSCLGPITLPDAGIWIGFETDLRPISGYAIRLDIVDRVGTFWPFPVSTDGRGDESFLEWRFRTGLYQNLPHLVRELGTPLRHRVLRSIPVFPVVDAAPGDATPTVAVSDKAFEDALYVAVGERQDKIGEASVTVLWRRDAQTLFAHGLLVESREPLHRSTETVSIRVVGNGTLTAERSRQVLQSPNLQASAGIKQVFRSESGFSLFAELGDVAAGIKLVLSQNMLDRIPRSIHAAATIEIAYAVLAVRSAGEG